MKIIDLKKYKKKESKKRKEKREEIIKKIIKLSDHLYPNKI